MEKIVCVLASISMISLTAAANVDLGNSACVPSVTTLPDNSGELIISNSTASCTWKLAFNAGKRLKLESKELCLSCSEVLKFMDDRFTVVWDVDTVHQQNGGSAGEKVCTKQKPAGYCDLLKAKELTTQSQPISLQYTRSSTSNEVSIKFSYTLTDVPPTPTSTPTTTPSTTPAQPRTSQSTTSSASSVLLNRSVCMTLLATLYILL